MIYLTVGSSSVPFDRLVAEVDQLAGDGALGEVVAQIGCANHLPAHVKYFRFGVGDEHLNHLRDAQFVICHAGAATLDEALALGKKVIVVPRRAKWKEAPDDHQLDLARLLARKNLVLCVEELPELRRLAREVADWRPDTRSKFGRNQVAETITEFLDSVLEERED